MDRAKKRESDRRHRLKKKARAIAYLGGKCVHCETTDELEFDHIDSSSKSFAIAKAWNRRWEVLVVELDKCQLLCRPCHRVKSVVHGDLSWKSLPI